MRPRILFRTFITLMLWLACGQVSEASHFLGGDLTYQALGNNRYKLSLQVYRDCSGVALYPDADFVCSPTGCTTTGTSVITVSNVPLIGGSTIGTPYCSSAPGGQGPCGTGLATNYETGRYETIVTLNPAVEWRISVTDNARPDLANITGNTDIRYEAVLRNQLSNNQVIQNTSPIFASQPTQFAGWRLPTTLSQLAVDADGDSLVYSLEAPLQACNSPVQYLPFNSSSYLDASAQNGGQPCLAQITGAPSQYHPAFPLPSFSYTGACPMKQAVPNFGFTPAAGAMQFTPAFFTAGTSTLDQSKNKYAVAVKVSEYRRINGTYILLGHVRRDIMIFVVDCGSNQNPTLGPVVSGSNSWQASGIIPVTAGRLISLNLTGLDANAGQVLTLSSNAEQVLPNAEFAPSAPGTQPSAQLNWLPPATLQPGLYYCTVTATDNACPIKGSSQQTLTFRVGNTTLATASTRAVATLAAVPTPFHQQVGFHLTQAGVQTVVVFDHLGRQVATLRSLPTGEVRWRPAAGVPAGLYLARTPDGRQVARLLRTSDE